MAATHRATVRWQRTGDDFDIKTFRREHVIEYEGGERVRASAAPDYSGDPSCVDPEQGLTGSLSSCHMLTFLAIASLRGYVVDAYEDEAEAELGKNDRGRSFVAKITLRPQVRFGGAKRPDAEAFAALHRKAHENCFIANSVRSEVVIEPRISAV